MPQGLSNAIRSWVEQFPVDEARRDLVELEAERREISERIAALTDTLAMWERLSVTSRSENGREHLPPPWSEAPTKRLAALAFLAANPGREFKLSEIFDALIDAGMVNDPKADYHALQVAMGKAVRKGQVERKRKGFYKSAARTHVQGEDGDGS